MKTNLNVECKNLATIIDNLATGKETCEISNDNFTLKDVIDYLNGFLDELKNLNNSYKNDLKNFTIFSI